MDLYLKIVGKPIADIFRARGLAHAKLRQYDRAVEDYTQALDIDQRENRTPNAKTLAYRGWAYVLCDAPRLARADFDTVSQRRHRADADALAGRGMPASAWRDQGGARDAEAALREGESSERLRFTAARIYALAASRRRAGCPDQRTPSQPNGRAAATPPLRGPRHRPS